MTSATLLRPLSIALLLAIAALSVGCRDSSESPANAPPASGETPEIVDLGEPIEDDREAAITPIRGDSGMLARPVGKLPADYRFVERSGKEMRFADVQGKFAVVDFIFTSCAGPCPPMAEQMGALQEKVRDMDDVVLVSISVDPRTDTPEVLADYAESVNADADKWLFARMPIDFVNELTYSEFLFADLGDPRAHSTLFVLVDRQGKGRAMYHPLKDSGWIEKVMKDLETLRAESP
jgi:protein SCO1/2